MNDTTENVIEVRDLVVRYGDMTVLDGVSFDIRRGETFVILGGSGCGKSTLLRNLVGLMRPDSGSIRVNGREFTTMTDMERTEVRKRIGMCFQGAALFNSMTVGDNVGLPLRDHTRLKESTIQIMTRIKLELVGLGHRLDHFPSQLSGGEQQRVAIARAIAKRPEVLLCDEPTGALDVTTGITVLEAVEHINRELGTLAVIITHNAVMSGMADRVLHLSDGRLVREQRNTTKVKASSLEW